MSGTGYLLEMLAGLGLFGIGGALNIYAGRQMRVFTVRTRFLVAAISVAVMIGIWLGVGLTGATHLWVLPGGLASAGVVELMLLRVLQHRTARQT